MKLSFSCSGKMRDVKKCTLLHFIRKPVSILFLKGIIILEKVKNLKLFLKKGSSLKSFLYLSSFCMLFRI
ncbi:MAG: hypothetical protein DRP91_08925 [Candidatus Neomarinimicrobiota bacterium]|nr:MAG: hypothetical protein DRP91_08925 [Candidatus Neomarinimicrobiota bacterium]